MMDALPEAPPQVPARGRTSVVVAGSVLLGLILWVLVFWPHDGSASDAVQGGWGLLAAADYKAGVELGVESISRFGPLGFLVVDGSLADEETHLARLATQCLMKVLAVLGLILASLCVRPWPFRLAWLLLPLWMLVRVPGAIYPLAMAAWTVACVWDRRGGRLLYACAIVFLAVLASAALSHFLLAVPCVLALTFFGGREFSWGKLAIVPLSFAALFVGAWLGTGQPLTNLPTFFASWWQVLVASADFVALTEPRSLPLLVALVGGFLCLALFVAAFFRPFSLRKLVATGVVALACYVSIKPGLVIQDSGQLLLYYTLGALLAALIPAAAELGRFTGTLLNFARGAALGVAVVAMILMAGDRGWSLADTPQVYESRLQWARRLLLAPDEGRLKLEEERQFRTTARLSEEARRLLGGQSADTFGAAPIPIFPGVARHRPVFQSGLAATRTLIGANADFANAEASPSFVLARLERTREILPTLIDSGTFAALCHSHRPVHEDENGLLLKLRPDAGEMPAFRDGGWTTVKFGDEVAVGRFPGKIKFLSVFLELSDLGVTRRVLYRDPPVELTLVIPGGEELRFRISPQAARSPFLVSPLITSTADWSSFYRGLALPTVATLRVDVRENHKRFFKPEFRVQVHYNDALDPSRSIRRTIPRKLPPRVLSLLPAEVEVAKPVGNFERIEEGGRTVLQAHPPSEVRFRLAAGRWRLTGRFGIQPKAWTEGKTDGVAFVVMTENPNEKPVEIFRSWLRPTEHEADREERALDVSFTFDVKKTLILLTGPGPERNADWDWAYWTDLRLEREPD